MSFMGMAEQNEIVIPQNRENRTACAGGFSTNIMMPGKGNSSDVDSTGLNRYRSDRTKGKMLALQVSNLDLISDIP